MSQLAAETGAQLVARLSSVCRPQVHNLDSTLFPNNGPYPKEIVEISGDVDVGKTTLLMHIIGKIVLPLQYGGRDGMVLLFLNDHNFDMNKFICILEKFVRENDSSSESMNETIVYDIVKMSLENITFQRCFSDDQFQIGIFGLAEKLSKDNRYCLLAVDSIGAFYWSQYEETGRSLYIKNLLKKLARFAHEFHLVLVYTKPAFVCDSSVSDRSVKVNYFFELVDTEEEADESNLVCKVNIPDKQETFLCHYEFDDRGIVTWKK